MRRAIVMGHTDCAGHGSDAAAAAAVADGARRIRAAMPDGFEVDTLMYDVATGRGHAGLSAAAAAGRRPRSHQRRIAGARTPSHVTSAAYAPSRTPIPPLRWWRRVTLAHSDRSPTPSAVDVRRHDARGSAFVTPTAQFRHQCVLIRSGSRT